MQQEDNPQLPVSLLTKLYDATGARDGSNKGYFLFFINEKGEPTLTCRTSNECMRSALHRTIDIYNQSHME